MKILVPSGLRTGPEIPVSTMVQVPCRSKWKICLEKGVGREDNDGGIVWRVVSLRTMEETNLLLFLTGPP